jgi:DNA-binding MarR family transcriptional regulator
MPRSRTWQSMECDRLQYADACMPNKNAVKDVMDAFRSLVQTLRSSHRAAENVDVTGAQLFVLSIVAEAKGAMSIGELAEQTRTDPSTVSVVVSRLVERGFIRRQRSSADARRTELALTAAGRRLRARAPQTVAQKRLAESLEKLSDRDLAMLRRILRAIVTDMGAVPTARPPMMFDESSDRPRKRTAGRKMY